MKKSNSPAVLQSKTPKSYKNKKLNNANFDNFNLNDYQVFLHLISKIGGVDEYGKYLQPHKLQREHILTAKEFSSLFNTNIHHSYRVLKKAIDKLMKTDIKVEKEDDSGFCRINVCSKAEYSKNQGHIIVKFTDDIMPYLAQVKKKFVLYNLKEVANFGSLYTTRLYELIQEFKETGWLVKSVDQLMSDLGDAILADNNEAMKVAFKNLKTGLIGRIKNKAQDLKGHLEKKYTNENYEEADDEFDTGGYVEAMGPELDKHIKAIAGIFQEWENGPSTEPQMVGYAMYDLIEYIKKAIRR